MSINVPHNFTPRSYQLKMFQAMDGVEGKPETKKKRVFLRWHRRAGKDKCCWCYMVKEAARVAGNYFYVFPVAKEAKAALWDNVDKDGFKLLNHIPKALISRINNQEMVIQLTNGSTIRVIGLDHNPDGIRGVACKGAVFSEFAYQDPTAYKILMPSLRESGGWVIFNSTPQGRNHMYDMDNSVKGSPRWHYSTLQTMWPDRENYSGLVSPDDLTYIQDEEGLTEDDMEREYGVSYSAGVKGSFYMEHIEKARAQGRIGDFMPDDHMWVDTFWDLGVDDSTAVWFRQVQGNRIIWIDYYEESGKDVAFYVKMLQEKGYNYRTHFLPWDGGNRTIQTQFRTEDIFRQLLQQAGLPSDVVVAPKMSVQEGINAVRSRFSRFFFNEGLCSDGINKLELYHRRWDSKRQVFLKEPVHDSNSHCADAIRTEALAEEFLEDPFEELNGIGSLSDYDIFDD